ncbi:hypothetical protein EASAB2608_04284 [Streptomyces sp. EAS-AB2608]|nr:hypothetical protein EASAB2608_04284 [Streptomyces sp. EAS-AB2608]
MPAPWAPPGRGLRCDAKGGDSFRTAAYRVSGGGPRPFGLWGRARAEEGSPYGVVPGGSRPIHPRIGGSPAPGTVRGAPDSAEAARPGDVRRRGVVRPDGNLANSCVFCEGWCAVCPIHFRDLGADSRPRDRVPPLCEQRKGAVPAKIN